MERSVMDTRESKEKRRADFTCVVNVVNGCTCTPLSPAPKGIGHSLFLDLVRRVLTGLLRGALLV